MATFKASKISEGASVETVVENFNSLVDKLNYVLNNLDYENVPSLSQKEDEDE